MKAIFDEDSANAVHFENQREAHEIRERRNQILAMTNPQKKQLAWKSVFGKPTYSPEIESMVW